MTKQKLKQADIHDIGFAIRDFLEQRWIATFTPIVVDEDGRDWSEDSESLKINEIDVSDVEAGKILIRLNNGQTFSISIDHEEVR